MKHWIVTGASLAIAVSTVATLYGAPDKPGNGATDKPDDGAPDGPESGLAATRLSVEARRRELWQLNMRAPRDTGDSHGLHEAIRRLELMSKLPDPPPDPPLPPKKAATTKPSKAATTRPAKTDTLRIDPALLDSIRKLKSVTDPTALADALFLAGYLDSAAIFYDRAAETDPSPTEKAWVLFQAGNCRRRTDPQAAMKVYDTLVAAHPNSLWGTIAQAQKDIITWRNTGSLAALLGDIEEQSPQSPGRGEGK